MKHPDHECTVPGCSVNAESRGLCQTHYARLTRGSGSVVLEIPDSEWATSLYGAATVAEGAVVDGGDDLYWRGWNDCAREIARRFIDAEAPAPAERVLP